MKAPLALITAAAALAAGFVIAGPLNPPGGPVASTYKTLSEVEPRIAINAANTPGDAGCVFKITQPGSYYLTDDVTGVSGKDGIDIVANHVTIDLNGFSVVGVPGSLMGISNLSYFSLSVHNGAMTAWGSYGLYNGGEDGRFNDLTVYRNGYAGLYANVSAVVQRCVAETNGDTGIAIGTDSLIREIGRAHV